MSYKNERASLNQISELIKYFDKYVYSEFKSIFSKNLNEEKEIKKENLKYFYTPKKIAENNIPLVSFDGGMANIFQNEIAETCFIKVAGACPPEFKERLDPFLKEEYIHTFTGKLIYSEDDKNLLEILKDEGKRLLENNSFKTALSFLKVKEEDFLDHFYALFLKHKEKSKIKDTIRDLLEWGMILEFILKFKEKTNNQELPYLIIKDGNIGTNPKVHTAIFANKLMEFLKEEGNLGFPLVIGAVKNSRYTGENSLYSVLHKFALNLDPVCFFKLPAKYEAIGDKDFNNRPFKRYFLSVFNGKNIYEIQIPIAIAKNNIILEKCFDLIASQISFSYGGIIITNTYAHLKASISEADSRMLEKKIFLKLNKEINNDEV